MRTKPSGSLVLTPPSQELPRTPGGGLRGPPGDRRALRWRCRRRAPLACSPAEPRPRGAACHPAVGVLAGVFLRPRRSCQGICDSAQDRTGVGDWGLPWEGRAVPAPARGTTRPGQDGAQQAGAGSQPGPSHDAGHRVPLQKELQHRHVSRCRLAGLAGLPAQGPGPLRVPAGGLPAAPHLPAVGPHPRRGAGQGLLRPGHQGTGRGVLPPTSARGGHHVQPLGSRATALSSASSGWGGQGPSKVDPELDGEQGRRAGQPRLI